MRRATQHGRWLQSAVALLIIGGLGFWFTAEVNKPLGAEDLKIAVSELRSHAAEGRLIAEQALSARLTATFFQTQTSMLRDKAGAVVKDLNSTAPRAGLEEELSRVKAFAERISADLASLSSSFDDRQEMSRLQEDLDTVFRQALEMEESLKH
ncbi:MAG: hypothetical protein V7641_883 [Blastocatellia bacterium]